MIIIVNSENKIVATHDDSQTITQGMYPNAQIKYIPTEYIYTILHEEPADGDGNQTMTTILGTDITGNIYVTNPPKSKNEILQDQIDFLIIQLLK